MTHSTTFHFSSENTHTYIDIADDTGDDIQHALDKVFGQGIISVDTPSAFSGDRSVSYRLRCPFILNREQLSSLEATVSSRGASVTYSEEPGVGGQTIRSAVRPRKRRHWWSVLTSTERVTILLSVLVFFYCVGALVFATRERPVCFDQFVPLLGQYFSARIKSALPS